jgi:hypothetical protein
MINLIYKNKKKETIKDENVGTSFKGNFLIIQYTDSMGYIKKERIIPSSKIKEVIWEEKKNIT